MQKKGEFFTVEQNVIAGSIDSISGNICFLCTMAEAHLKPCQISKIGIFENG